MSGKINNYSDLEDVDGFLPDFSEYLCSKMVRNLLE